MTGSVRARREQSVDPFGAPRSTYQVPGSAPSTAPSRPATPAPAPTRSKYSSPSDTPTMDPAERLARRRAKMMGRSEEEWRLFAGPDLSGVSVPGGFNGGVAAPPTSMPSTPAPPASSDQAGEAPLAAPSMQSLSTAIATSGAASDMGDDTLNLETLMGMTEGRPGLGQRQLPGLPPSLAALQRALY